jgi:hypothetical protein
MDLAGIAQGADANSFTASRSDMTKLATGQVFGTLDRSTHEWPDIR